MIDSLLLMLCDPLFNKEELLKEFRLSQADSRIDFAAVEDNAYRVDLEAVGEEIRRLSDVPAIGRGRLMSMVITPFVFALESSPALVTNHEVAAAVWVPVGFIADHSNRETMSYRRAELSLELPCYHYRDHLIWGMTLGMVDELLSLVSH